jgi:nucleoid DNA-binding protein
MRELELEDLLHEFYLQFHANYPDLTYDEVKKIVTYQWAFAREVIESGNLDKIRLKGFGTFQVYHGRARGCLKGNYERFEKGYIDSNFYFKQKEKLEKYLKRIEEGEVTVIKKRKIKKQVFNHKNLKNDKD